MIPELALKIKSSRLLAFNLILLHVFSLVCLALYSCHWLIKITLLSLVLINGFYSHYHYARLLGAKSIHNLELNTRGEWWLHYKELKCKAKLLGNSLVTQYLIILNFKTAAYLETNVVLLRDSVSAEEWRKLRVYLETH